jgi:hypothetical protein
MCTSHEKDGGWADGLTADGVRGYLRDLGMRPETTSGAPKTEPDVITG